MFLDTQPASLGSDGSIDPWGPFRVDSLTERAALLRQLRDGSVPVNLSAPDGSAMRSVNLVPGADAGEPAALGVEMRRPISATMTTRPATISRPIDITSTFSQIGAEARAGDAKTTP